jgi:sugar lactone lactonase YvrE
MKLLLPSGLLALCLVSSGWAATSESAVPAKAPPRKFTVVALANPRAIAVDAAGNLYVGEVDSGTVYKITPTGEATALGGSGTAIKDPVGVAVGRDGAVYVADADSNAAFRIAPDGKVTSLGRPASGPADVGLTTPTSIVADAAGNAFVTNNGNNVILKLTPQGAMSVFAGKPGTDGSEDGAGGAARLASPRGIAIDPAGNLYVADEGNSNIRMITPAGAVSTLAGEARQTGSSDGTGKAAHFAAPRGVAADASGNVYVADTDNHVIRKVTKSGVVTTLAGHLGDNGKADGTGSAARFSEPRGVAVDAAGNVYVADTGNGAVRMITPEGVVTTIAGEAKP